MTFSHKSARCTLLPLPRTTARRWVLWAYLSPVYSALQAFVVVLYFVVLACVQYSHETFVDSYLSGLLLSCGSAAHHVDIDAQPNLTSALGDIWQWRQALRNTPDLQSAQCSAFLATSLAEIQSLPFGSESARDWVVSACTIFFAFDTLLSMVGAIGLQWHTQRNVFCAGLMSLINLFGFAMPHLFVVGVLRIFITMYRTAKSFRFSGTVRVMRGLAQAALGILPLCILMAGFIFFCAILGLQLFGSDVAAIENPPPYPISNFASLFVNEWGYGALLTVIQILTGENWNEVLTTHQH